MVVHIEFYGIPRSRTGVCRTEFELNEPTATLAQLVCRLQDRFPEFATDCLVGGEFNRSVIASLDGNRFIRDVTTTIRDGETLLIMSADGGG